MLPENINWGMVAVLVVLLLLFFHCFGEQMFIRPFKKGGGKDIVKK